MKSKPEIVKINKENWRQIVVDSLFNTLSLARSSKLLLKENMKENKDVVFEQPHMAAGLYLFAIEEYGKALILEDYEDSNGKIEVKYRYEFRNHNKKFEKALTNLPKKCKLLYKGSFGRGFGKGFDIDEFASIENRMSIFYSDLNEKGNVNILPQVDAKKLQDCLKEFIEIIEEHLVSFNIQNPPGSNTKT